MATQKYRDYEKAIVEFTRAYDRGYSRRPDPSQHIFDSIHFQIDQSYWNLRSDFDYKLKCEKRFYWHKLWVEDEPWCPHAFSALSSFYSNGIGVAENHRMAFELLQKGAAVSDRSDNPCFELLGYCYLYGNLNTVKNPTLALQWLDKVSPQKPALEEIVKKLRDGN